MLEVTSEETARDRGLDLPRLTGDSGIDTIHAVTGRGYWMAGWLLVNNLALQPQGRHFPEHLTFQSLLLLEQSATSCVPWHPRWLLQTGPDAEDNARWSLGTWQSLGAEGLSLTLSSRSSFPRNPLDAKMGIPGNTVLEVMV